MGLDPHQITYHSLTTTSETEKKLITDHMETLALFQ